VLIESDYRSHRIEVNAVAEGDLLQAGAHAERAGMLWAKRWIDLQAEKADA
jgi:hypothetical protein